MSQPAIPSRVDSPTTRKLKDLKPLPKKFILDTLRKEAPMKAEIKKIFQAMDVNGDNRLDINEFGAALQARGINYGTADDLEALFAMLDNDGNGEIDLSEFERCLGLPDPAGLNQKMQWLQAVGVLECLARRLPEGALNESVLSVEDKDGWSKLFQGLQEEILGLVMDGQEDIKRSAVASMRVDSMNSKFSSVGDCKVGVYGTLEDFAKGLDAAVGLPNVNVWETMKREHCSGPDHSEIFETHYNREETTSELEWQCVADAEQGKTYPGDRKDAPPLDFFLKMAGVSEAKIGDGERNAFRMHILRTEIAPRLRYDDLIASANAPGATWESLCSDFPDKIEKRTLQELADEALDVLANAGLSKEEIVALRLYSGPTFVKYNRSLRSTLVDINKEQQGNRYTTTLHAINSGLLKLQRFSKVPKKHVVYRGVSGLALPPEFLHEDQFGCKGGVEKGFLSTTTDLTVAMAYAQKGTNPTVWKMTVGQVDRGSSVGWLSQYPREAEILFPPLSNIEVRKDPVMESIDLAGTKVMITIINMRINTNTKSLTLDEMKERRRTIHLQILGNVLDETRRDIESNVEKVKTARDSIDVKIIKEVTDAILDNISQEESRHQSHKAEHYNVDVNYKNAITEAVDLKRHAVLKHDVALQSRELAMRKKVLETDVGKFGNLGIVYQLKSGYEKFHWVEVCSRKVPHVILPLDMDRRQVRIAWECMWEVKETITEIIITGGPLGEKQHKLKHMFIGETPCISLWEELDIHVLGAMAPFYKHERREKFKLLVDEDGYTALHRMCMDENTAPELALEIVKELVDCGGGELVGAVIPAHKKREGDSFEGATALHLASYYGFHDIVKELISFGTQLATITTATGCTALHFATQNSYPDICKQLVDNGGEGKLLMIQAYDNDPEFAGQTALHIAAKNVQRDLVFDYLKCGGKQLAFLQDKEGKTALHIAAEMEDFEIVEEIIKYGEASLVCIPEKMGKTALHYAVEHWRLDSLKALLKCAGVTLAIMVSGEGETALHTAAWHGHTQMIDDLIQIAKDDGILDMKNYGDEDTALHIACAHNRHEVVELLLAAGGEQLAAIKNKMKQSALHIAVTKANSGQPMVDALIKVGGKDLVTLKNYEGKTALHLACQNAELGFAKALVACGGSHIVEMEDNNGKTALHYAQKNSKGDEDFAAKYKELTGQ